jgi:glycosyltransferase involved in cell wall biosynthesis
MLSICIPIYNYNVTGLVKSLDEQAKASGFRYEIIVIDDCSSSEYKIINRDLVNTGSVLYLELNQNIGRSAIRNLFLNYVHFDYLLFLDCDSQVIDNQFIIKYLKHCNGAEKVICGGTLYSTKPTGRKFKLRWKYGVYRECLSLEKRSKNPYLSFKANNFLIHKNVLAKNRFEEKLTKYGHEDSLFGYSLMQSKLEVININNPVIHDISEPYSEYLIKTGQALQNLYFISSKMKMGSDFKDMIRLLKVYAGIKKFYLQGPVLLLFLVSKPVIIFSFRMGIVSLFVFDFYKLGYYTRLGFSFSKKNGKEID